MNFVHVFGASTAAFLILGNGAAIAGETINDVGAIACVSHANNRDVRLMAQSGHASRIRRMSAFGGKADMTRTVAADVR